MTPECLFIELYDIKLILPLVLSEENSWVQMMANRMNSPYLGSCCQSNQSEQISNPDPDIADFGTCFFLSPCILYFQSLFVNEVPVKLSWLRQDILDGFEFLEGDWLGNVQLLEDHS